ncbi:MAG: response regulator, partial [Nitrospirae bacterium]|nr:response regulator [Nitrospirota bacterium]
MKRILIVDDDLEIREDLSEVLRESGYEVDEAVSGNDAIGKVSAHKYDIALLDLVMPGISGIETLNEIKKSSPKIKVIIITAFSTIGSAVESIKTGASDYISKPFKIEELLTIISRVIEETKFEEDMKGSDIDNILSSIANPIRRRIIKLLNLNKKQRFMEIIKEIEMENEHQKVVFHLKMLKQAG